MARLNTANPLVNSTPQRGRGVLKSTPRTSQTLDGSIPSKEPCSYLKKSPIKHTVTTSAQNQPRRQMARSSTLFDILPDSESTSESEIGHRKPTGKQARTRTLGLARVNSLLLPTKQRPRPAFRENADYDKENDVPEHTTDGFRTPDSIPSRQTPPRENTPRRSRTGDSATRHPTADDREEEIEDQGLDDSFDSIDDFIVSDNEELSSHEASDHETPNTEDEPTPAASPIRSPRKRLLRGRKPAAETEPRVLAHEKPSMETTDSELELDNTTCKPTRTTPDCEDCAPSPIFGLHPEPLVYEADNTKHRDDSTRAPKSRLHNSNDLIKHLENLELSSESEDEPPPTLKPGHKDSPPLTPSTTRIKDTPPTTIRAQKKAEAARKREILGFAEEFLQHLDNAFDGRITNMTKDTGGIKLIWTKNFRNTAGRATVRSERVFTGKGGVEDPGRRRYDATIELSEKVLDTEDKILCTLTHEYCHLLDILITENRGKGAAQHGASFKQWGARCTRALDGHPIYGGRVEVTTKHTYEINHKYLWACVVLGCPFEVGRHSKSVDPVRHRCGRCRGYLKQIKPVPRAAPKKKYEKVVINLEDD
ncbi:uncharacterized protein N7529_003832 [Penicillium soppii]|uniref:uncharacterized protein n=1 Tax=Penicillium soppii TaxID=69789 RepID=UPI00254842ED|nr:uncharacterized protein N7529_003832 [Penicillium soppii]KAJ5871479.1 hypothetical protein N7529_003832 [Penicillium soppii]